MRAVALLATSLLLSPSALAVDPWHEEGETLRALSGASRGGAKAEVLLRLGEWEREAASRLRTVSAEGAAVDARIAAHLQAAVEAFTAALPLAAPARQPQLLFSLGDLERFRGRTEAARTPLGRLVDEYSDHPLAADAAISLGDDAFDDGALADAIRRFEFAAAHGSSASAIAYARYKLGWCRMNLDEFAEARALFLQVIETTDESGAALPLAQEAGRDLVLAFARDPQVSGAEAEASLRRALPAEKVRRYLAGYARLISSSGRDEEAAMLLTRLEIGAPPPDAIALFTAELEIATRRRDLPAVVRAGRHLAAVVEAFSLPAGEALKASERALRVAAVTLHGEGRVAGKAAPLEAALALYAAYFTAFDASEAAYELHHHAGELLLALHRPAQAEVHYTAAVERDLERLARGDNPGRWLESSAHGAVLAAQAALPDRPLPVAAAPTEEEVDREPPGPTPFEDGESRLIAACERYLQALPKGPDAVQASYQRALVLFRHNRFVDAGRAFRAIAVEHAETDVAPFAAQLALDALRQLGAYDELAATAAELRGTASLAARVGEDLSHLREAALLAAAARETKRLRPVAAAARYLAFAEAFPSSERLDRALYNAAAALAQQGRFGEAVSTRARLISSLPRSALAGRARERQLEDLLRLGRFGEARALAEELARSATGPAAATRLHDAIVLAEAAAEPARADSLREQYLSRFPKAADAFAHALELADRRRGCESGGRALAVALRSARDDGARAIVFTRSARLETRCRQESRGRWYAREAIAAAGRQANPSPEALDAAAEASLLLAEPALKRFRELPVRAPFESTIPRKLAALKSADAQLAAVVARGRAGPAVCALVGSGLSYTELARALSSATAPRAFTEEQRALFEEALATQAQPLFDRAREALVEALGKARDARVLPPCLDGARTALASLWPERYGPRLEIVLPLAPAPTADARASALLDHLSDAPAAVLLVAESALAEGHAHAALLLTDRIEARDPLRPAALEVRARSLELLGRKDAALALWHELLASHPERPLARRVLGDRALDDRDLELARSHLIALKSSDPIDSAVVVDLAVVLRGLGDLAGAEQASRDALKLAPSRTEALLNLGLLLCSDAGRPAEGTRALEEFLARQGNPPDRPGFDASLAACRALSREGS